MILQELGDNFMIACRKSEKPSLLRTVRGDESGHVRLSDAILLSETPVILRPLLRSDLRNIGGLRRRYYHHRLRISGMLVRNRYLNLCVLSERDL